MKQRQKPDHLKKIAGGIFIVIAIALTVFAFIVQAEQRKEAELDRRDQEKFSQLEVKMNEVLGEFQKIAPEGEWELSKSCGRTGGKFESPDDQKFCNLTISTSKTLPITLDKLNQVVAAKNIILDQRFYNNEENRTLLYSEEKNGEVSCTLVSFGQSKAEVEGPLFNCKSDARKYYYTQL
jgi:hypothetical protein